MVQTFTKQQAETTPVDGVYKTTQQHVCFLFAKWEIEGSETQLGEALQRVQDYYRADSNFWSTVTL